MRVFRLLGSWIFAAFLLAAPALAQDAVPDHRYLYSSDVDFYGADLTNLFDTTQDACERACTAQSDCVAFTYNTRSNACFPKSAITDRKPYQGARSAQKIMTDPQVVAGAAQRRQDLSFFDDAEISAARDLALRIARQFPVHGADLGDLRAAITAAISAGRLAQARTWAAQAVALTDQPDMWVSYATLSLRQSRSPDSTDSYGDTQEAVLSAVNGYLRAQDPDVQAQALEVLADALDQTGRGRETIPALRLAERLAPGDDIAAKLDQAIDRYGFRIVDDQVDNDSAAPRICAEFSEDLVQAGVDYEPFVRVPGPGLVVEAQGRQLCIDGVEHGQRYDVTFRAGLPAASGEVLHKDIPLKVYVRDRTPLARFAGRAYVLPRAATAALPVETVNVDTLDLTLSRVSDRNLVRAIRESWFGRPLSAYEQDQFTTDLAQEIWTGTGTVENTLNVEMTTRLPLGDVLEDEAPGIYTLSAAVPGQDRNDHPAATQWFVLSDLGLSTWSGIDGMEVAVRGLADTDAREGVTLTLISRANAVLGTAVTDADGFASFPAGLVRGEGTASPALLLAEEGTDLAFLPLTDPAFDLSDRGVEGNPPAPPIDTFLTTDRGAYRVGETIHVTSLTRDATGEALTGLPLTAILTRPDGVEYSRAQSTDPVAGGHVFTLPLGPDVPRGTWRLDVLSDVDAPALASQTVLVEDFLPERIDFAMTLPDMPLALGDTPPLTVDVRYLFGAPGADLEVEGDVRLRATRALPGWEGYLFGRHDSSFNTQTRSIGDAVTDDSGQATLALQLPRIDEDPGQPLEAEVILRVSEGSGRPVERRKTVQVAADAPLIGIKPLFDDVLPEGTEAAFEVIAVDPQGQAAPMQVNWTLNRIDTQYQWYQMYGNWEWEPTTRRVRVQSGEAALDTTPVRIAAPTEWGEYELVLERVGTPYAASSVKFSSGWYGGDGSTDTPDRLEMSLDATEYSVGDTVELRMVPENDGIALITVLSNQVIARKVVPVTAGETRVPLEVTKDWGTGAYVTAAVLHGLDVATQQNPSRSLGLAHAAVRPGDRELSVSFDAPESIDGQAGTTKVAVLVDGVTPGETAYVTLAAVDVGILNLTAFDAPDPTGHYFGQRRLGVEMRDIYGRLIDGMNGAMGAVRSGGDAAASARTQSPPPADGGPDGLLRRAGRRRP